MKTFRVVFAAAACLCTFAQEPPPPLEIRDLLFVPELRRIDVNFSEPVEGTAANLLPTNVTVTSEPPIAVVRVSRPGAFTRRLRIQYSGDLPASGSVTITFGALEYRAGQTTRTARKVTRTAAIESTEAALDRIRTAIRETPKTSREKNIFASGFVVSASGGSEGGADIALNDVLQSLPNTSSFLNLRKATQEGGDHKNFEGGVRHRTAILLPGSRAHFRKMRPGATAQDIQDAQTALQSRWFSGALFDLAAKLEGEATDFNVSNFVGETALQFRTTVKSIAGKQGFWRGFILPVAFEGGQSLRAGDESGVAATNSGLRQVDWIARYKAGAGMTFFFDDPDTTLPVKRIELDLEAVLRNLFFKEAMYDEATKMVDETGKGIRGYGQADLKLYVGESDAARWGIRLTYNRGSLPPVFARVKSFQFGFLFETKN